MSQLTKMVSGASLPEVLPEAEFAEAFKDTAISERTINRSSFIRPTLRRVRESATGCASARDPGHLGRTIRRWYGRRRRCLRRRWRLLPGRAIAGHWHRWRPAECALRCCVARPPREWLSVAATPPARPPPDDCRSC